MFGRRKALAQDRARHPSNPDPNTAAGRWAIQNAAQLAHPFCQCGAPATWERHIPAQDGYSLSLTCDKHLYVNGWSQEGNGPWEPSTPSPLSYWAAARAEFIPLRSLS